MRCSKRIPLAHSVAGGLAVAPIVPHRHFLIEYKSSLSQGETRLLLCFISIMTIDSWISCLCVREFMLVLGYVVFVREKSRLGVFSKRDWKTWNKWLVCAFVGSFNSIFFDKVKVVGSGKYIWLARIEPYGWIGSISRLKNEVYIRVDWMKKNCISSEKIKI